MLVEGSAQLRVSRLHDSGKGGGYAVLAADVQLVAHHVHQVVDRHVALLLEAAGVGEHELPRLGVGLDPLLGLGNVLLASHAQAEDLKLVALGFGAVSLVVTH